MTPTTYCNHTAQHGVSDAVPVLTERGVSKGTILALFALARHADQEHQMFCFVSYETIAQESGLSRRGSIYAIDALREAGLIHIIPAEMLKDPRVSAIFDGKVNSSSNYYVLTLAGIVSWWELSGEAASLLADIASAAIAPPSAAASLALVQPLHPASAAIAPEVVKEIEPIEVVPEVVKLSSSAQQQDHHRGHPVPVSNTGGAGGKAPAFKPITVKPKTPGPTPVPSSTSRKPERLLTERYFELMGEPRKHGEKLAVIWPGAFTRLLAHHSYTDLRGAMDWAWLTDDFWPSRLRQNKIDPIDYFGEKHDTIMQQFKSSQQTSARKTGKATQGNVPAIDPAKLRMFKRK